MATAAQIDQSRQLMEQQDAARQKAIAAAIALAVARTRAFNDWYSTAAITTWALLLARGMELIQRNLARQTDVFLSRQSTLMAGRPVRPVGAVDVATLRRGITHAGAYGRVADVFRYQQSKIDAAGADAQELIAPLEAAVERAQAVAEMDTQLVVRAQAQKFFLIQPPALIQPARAAEQPGPGPDPAELQQSEPAPEPSPGQDTGKPKLIGYRRMIHPEMSKTGSCGMCIVASHRLYHVEDLMPIHANCNCLPLPVYEGSDPGSVINDQDLARFYREAGGKQAEELKKTRYQIDEHGELGPVLNSYGASFRSRADVAADTDRIQKLLDASAKKMRRS